MAGSDLFSRKIFVIILALLCSARAMSMIDNHSLEEKQIEEYYLDHEVSEMEAFAAARSADINESPVGCKTCTVDQLMYCFGNGLLNDHCCCDKRYEETLPFIPHSCYLSSKTCTLHAANCGEYHRIKRCCCDSPLKKKWRIRSSASPKAVSNNLLMTAIAALVVKLYVACI
ncbi:uncharacterized protein LOC113363757 [Ctenocephalides felis]|uniref:uncharacterized protein LOC113363757 n=1 Tax=Ctenocephalides felis TaxID=7515 RepID=UPI000E6E581F|nr:uncharacterized protein LOC113363757 [Ctenocephalides felis]XP_026462027.1 uncharacterized protein LOC113363757 [Ctenocephalides felis]